MARDHVITDRDFGKDHWTTLVYVETRCVDHKGVLQDEHMRTDGDRHPTRVSRRIPPGMHGKGEYATRLRGGSEIFGHDDWDCLLDLEREGYVILGGADRLRLSQSIEVSLTPKGWRAVGSLRRRRAQGQRYWQTYRPQPPRPTAARDDAQAA